MHRWTRVLSAALALAGIVSLAGCGEPDVYLQFWYVPGNDALASMYQKLTDEYTAAHSKTHIQLVPLSEADLRDRMAAGWEHDDYPDLYVTPGDVALQKDVATGKVADLTQALSGTVAEFGAAANMWNFNSVQYGLPTSVDVTGFVYNKQTFATAGIEIPESFTYNDMVEVIEKLKAADITPFAVGAADRWPTVAWYENAAIRSCARNILMSELANGDLKDACWTSAAQQVQAYLSQNDFGDGFNMVTMDGDNSATNRVASGKAGMELVASSVVSGLFSHGDTADTLGWLPYPVIPEDGVSGNKTVLGSVQGLACTTRHTEQCVDVLKYLTSADAQTQMVATNAVWMPSRAASPTGGVEVSTAGIAPSIVATLKAADAIQVPFDQVLAPAKASALETAVVGYFSGRGTAETVAAAVSAA